MPLELPAQTIALFDCLADGVIVSLTTDTVDYINPAALDLLAWEAADGAPDAKPTGWQSLLVPEDADKLHQIAERALRQPDSLTHELIVAVPGQETCLLAASACPMLAPTAVVWLVRRLNLSDSLSQAQESEWAEVLRAVPHHVYIFDLDTFEHRFENHPLGHYLGYSDEDLGTSPHTHWRDIIHPDDMTNVDLYQTMMESLKDGRDHLAVCRFRHKNGNWHFVQVKTSPYHRNPQGEVTHAIGIAQDISQEMSAQRKLASQEQRFRLLTENLTDIIWTTDEQFQVNYISPSFETELGFPIKKVLAGGNRAFFYSHELMELERFLSAQLKVMILKSRKGLLQSLPDFRHVREVAVDHADGRRLWLEVRASLLLSASGVIQGMLCTSRDITARKRADDELRLSAKVFQNSLAATLIIDTKGCVIQVNSAYTRITGYRADEVVGQDMGPFISDECDQRFRRVMAGAEKEGYWEGELNNQRKDGESFPCWMAITLVTDDRDRPISFIATFTDITDRKHSEERIQRLAYYDSLTGLPNRRLFADRLDQALAMAKRNQHFVALLFLDLDRFKAINDSMGHGVGDILLKNAALRLQNCVRKSDTVARMGGDEFTIIVGALSSREKASRSAACVAEKVRQELARPFILQGKETFIGTSIGISFFPQDTLDASVLIQNADTAMYHAKEAGKNNYQFYNESMTSNAMARLEMESSLHKALKQKEFCVHYQPLVAARDGRLVGVEALLRWQKPGQGLVEPGQFIGIAEESGLIVPIGAWVLQACCLQMAEWQAAGLELGRVAVNVSPRQFTEGKLVAQVKEALQKSQLDPRLLELEVTESIVMGDVEYAHGVLTELKQMGVSISIDDFGTGYSSLNYLRQFPIDKLKIDRSFVQALPGEEGEGIVRAVIALARSLRLEVVGEGVETPQQRQFLVQQGCQEMQGFLFCPPRKPESLLEFFNQSTAAQPTTSGTPDSQ